MLNGVNKKCLQCTEECKQFAQISIISCPNFITNKPNSNKVQPSHIENKEIKSIQPTSEDIKVMGHK